MNVRLIASSAVLLLAVTGCGGPDDRKPKSESASPGTTSRSAAPTVKVVYSYFNDEPFLRLAAQFTNPDSKMTRVGVESTWKAFDADGAIVGTDDISTPPIPPGGSVYYVGGDSGPDEDGALSGTPARVTVEITDTGQEVERAPSPTVKVTKASFTRSDSYAFDGTSEYDASVTIEALADLARESLWVDIRLMGTGGEIVGAEWSDLESMPRFISKGEKVKAIASVTVENGRTPTKIEAFAYEAYE